MTWDRAGEGARLAEERLVPWGVGGRQRAEALAFPKQGCTHGFGKDGRRQPPRRKDRREEEKQEKDVRTARQSQPLGVCPVVRVRDVQSTDRDE